MTELNVETNSENAKEDKRRLLPIAVSAVIAVVLLSFGGSFVGVRMALPATTENIVEEVDSAPEVDGDDLSIFPAGSDVRAGTGTPNAAYGKEGDIFIDIKTADVFVRTADSWTRAGNIRTTAQENLAGERGKTGKQGEAGEQGKAGSAGEQGASGSDGSQVVLGNEPPSGTCTAEDIFIDTVALDFYYCTNGAWTTPAQS